jgi:hypothetical protein
LNLFVKARSRVRALLVAACASLTLGTGVAAAALAAGGPDTGAVTVVIPPLPVASATVADHAAMQQSEPGQLAANPAGSAREVDCLTAAVYYEARGEPAAGQAAVAQVVLNRTHISTFPKTVCGVVYQGAGTGSCQFSFACHGGMRGRREPAAWERSRQVAQRALDGYVMTQVGTAAYFHVARLGAIWGGHMTRVAQVGQHIFYTRAERAELRRAVRMLEKQAATPASSAIAAPQQVAAVSTAPVPQPTPVATAPAPASAKASPTAS